MNIFEKYEKILTDEQNVKAKKKQTLAIDKLIIELKEINKFYKDDPTGTTLYNTIKNTGNILEKQKLQRLAIIRKEILQYLFPN